MDVGGRLRLLLLGIEDWVRESLTRQGRGERKKIIYKTTVTVHIILHINSVLDRLMWVVFEQKCVKFATFFYFARIGAIALRPTTNNVITISNMPSSSHD